MNELLNVVLLLCVLGILRFKTIIGQSDAIVDENDVHLIHIGNVEKDSCTVDKELSISFKGVPIFCDEQYHLAGFEKKPEVILNRANVHRYYTLIMVDPDAPSRKEPTQRSWLHWLIVNIENADVSTGFEAVKYEPPTPPKDTGPHRYIFLLIEQPEKETHYLTYPNRGKFDINKYATDHKLRNIAGLKYFRTEKSDNLKLPVIGDKSSGNKESST